KSVSHHDKTAQEGFASASHIRSLLLQGQLEEAKELVPESCHSLLDTSPVSVDDRIVLARLRTLSKEQLASLPDCSEGLENRLYQAIRDSISLEEIWDKTKSKRYSLARIRRLCMNAYLSVEGDLHQQLPPYLRVLGFNEKGREILAAMRKSAKLPVSSSLADLSSVSDLSQRFASLEAQSVDLYNLFEAEQKPCGQDYRFSPIRK
ncbi:MAG: nucleotidyltransferase family protein, partial [Oscillospiraceae bacterium]|nr:nucleotidyltransferase family protein [Oscillospiraceae bacterium]